MSLVPDACQGCHWCEKKEIPTFADEEELSDFFALHENIEFPMAPKLHPRFTFSARAEKQLGEGGRRVSKRRSDKSSVLFQAIESRLRPLVQEELVKEILG